MSARPIDNLMFTNENSKPESPEDELIRRMLEETEKKEPVSARLDEESLKRLRDIKPPKDSDAFTRIASVFLIAAWIVVNALNGLDFQWFGQQINMQFDANFLAQLGYLAITAAGVMLGTAVTGAGKRKDQ